MLWSNSGMCLVDLQNVSVANGRQCRNYLRPRCHCSMGPPHPLILEEAPSPSKIVWLRRHSWVEPPAFPEGESKWDVGFGGTKKK